VFSVIGSNWTGGDEKELATAAAGWGAEGCSYQERNGKKGRRGGIRVSPSTGPQRMERVERSKKVSGREQIARKMYILAAYETAARN